MVLRKGVFLSRVDLVEAPRVDVDCLLVSCGLVAYYVVDGIFEV